MNNSQGRLIEALESRRLLASAVATTEAPAPSQPSVLTERQSTSITLYASGIENLAFGLFVETRGIAAGETVRVFEGDQLVATITVSQEQTGRGELFARPVGTSHTFRAVYDGSATAMPASSGPVTGTVAPNPYAPRVEKVGGRLVMQFIPQRPYGVGGTVHFWNGDWSRQVTINMDEQAVLTEAPPEGIDHLYWSLSDHWIAYQGITHVLPDRVISVKPTTTRMWVGNQSPGAGNGNGPWLFAEFKSLDGTPLTGGMVAFYAKEAVTFRSREGDDWTPSPDGGRFMGGLVQAPSQTWINIEGVLPGTYTMWAVYEPMTGYAESTSTPVVVTIHPDRRITMVEGTTPDEPAPVVQPPGGGLEVVPPSPVPAGAAPVLMADFNADGTQDLLWRDPQTGKTVIQLVNGIGKTTGYRVLDTADPRWDLQAGGDLNGDGLDDLVWLNRATGRSLVWYMDGNANVKSTAAIQSGAVATGWRISGMGDFNKDGRDDIVWRNDVTMKASVWNMSGTSVRSFSMFNATPKSADWIIAAVGDMSGDGQTDLLWRNTRTGQNCLWRMRGTSVVGVQGLQQLAGSAWRVAGLFDVDGDDTTDIVFRNTTTGELRAWLMGDAAFEDLTSLTR